MADELVTVRIFSGEMEANIAASALKAFEIKCVLSHDDAGGMRPSLTMVQGIRLLVRPKDVKHAKEVLSQPDLLSYEQ